MQRNEQKDRQVSVHIEDSLHWSHSGSSVLDTPISSPQSVVDDFNSSDFSAAQTINLQNTGSRNRLHVRDVNSGNSGIIGGHNNILVQRFYSSAHARAGKPDELTSRSMVIAVAYIEATQHVLGALFGFASPNYCIPTESEKNGAESKLVEEYINHLIKSIKAVIEKDDSRITHALRDHLGTLRSELHKARSQLSNADKNYIVTVNVDIISRLRLFLFVNHMEEYIPSEIAIEEVKRRTKETRKNVEIAAPRKLIKDLVRAKAAYDDYVSSHQNRVSCFKGTRRALLKEMGEWVSNAETNIFVLSGLAGIGKSTIAQTVAQRADNVGFLGASFFFSRDEAERRTAERFFTTIAFQLCVHDLDFASAIENVLMTEQGRDAITKHPMEQLESLILEPLRKLSTRPVLIVVDALDECNEEDGPVVLQGLHKLVQSLTSFKVVLTTRPQQHFQLLLDGEGPQKLFHLHNIEEKIVDSDIRLYLKHHLSREMVRDRFQDPREVWNASDDDIESLVDAAGRLFIIASTSVLFVLDKHARDPEHRMKQLLEAIEHDRTPFEALNNFYTVILRSALPEGSNSRAIARYQSVVGAIMLIQTPLPVEQLATLIGYRPVDVHRVLGKLQPVILIDEVNDVPRVYHKSFPDYIQDPERCKDEDLRIDLKPRHTGMALNCFRMMNQQLRQNIFELGDPARFMDNAVLRERYITQHRFGEQFPFELRYACTYWANHVEGSATEDQGLVDNLETFVTEHLLHWFEALSWIEQLGPAHRSLLILQKQLSTSSDLGQLVADGLRFLQRFYVVIERSALHIYHSALPFTPTGTILYKRYSKQMSFCQVQGGQENWDAFITILRVGEVGGVIFSPDSKLFACDSGRSERSMKIYDAVAGIRYTHRKDRRRGDRDRK